MCDTVTGQTYFRPLGCTAAVAKLQILAAHLVRGVHAHITTQTLSYYLLLAHDPAATLYLPGRQVSSSSSQYSFVTRTHTHTHTMHGLPSWDTFHFSPQASVDANVMTVDSKAGDLFNSVFQRCLASVASSRNFSHGNNP